MAQYFPTNNVDKHPVLKRTVTAEEYELVVNAFHELGFQRGWIQELESNENYRPDFSTANPFHKAEFR